MTKKQLLYLETIKKLIKKNGCFPSLRQLSKAMGTSSKTTYSARQVLKKFIDRGLIGKKKTFSVTYLRDTKTKKIIKITVDSPYFLKSNDC
jgi:Mn-dependent DtxR family transcriptional regulator